MKEKEAASPFHTVTSCNLTASIFSSEAAAKVSSEFVYGEGQISAGQVRFISSNSATLRGMVA